MLIYTFKNCFDIHKKINKLLQYCHASCKEKQGTQAHSIISYSYIVIHAGAKNIHQKHSEITKDSLARTFQAARKMGRHRFIFSGPSAGK